MMNATPQQIAAAAAAGVELLSDRDLKVPLGVAMGGALGVLSNMLNALATGELVLVNAPPPEQKPAGDGEPDPPGLSRIEGGKKTGEGDGD
jgi:hypothetical protein